MKLVKGIDALDTPLDRCVLTIGNFDGVHRGHQQLLAQSGMFAAHTGNPVVVLTFEPHPLTIVAPDKAPLRLSTPDQKARLLAQYGANMVVIANSTPELLGLEAEDFIRQIIVDRFHPTHVVEGSSFGFGRGRRGTTQLLNDMGQQYDFHTHILDPVNLEIAPNETVLVSSSLVRQFLLNGKVRRASLCLGRPYTLGGRVIQGNQRGRDLGFPTANLDVQQQLIPADGVYGGHINIDGTDHLCAISIGNAPTFDEKTRRVEAHVLNWSGDLYGKNLDLSLTTRVRDNRPFESVDALITQLKQDVEYIQSHIQPNP